MWETLPPAPPPELPQPNPTAPPKVVQAKPVQPKPAPARRFDAEAEESAMEAAAGWLEELGEAGGKTGAVVRAFAAVFPPSARWGEPWADGIDADELPPFRPSAASYAAALREVAAGRRRVRVTGSWEEGAGVLMVGLVGPGAAASWTVVEAEGTA